MAIKKLEGPARGHEMIASALRRRSLVDDALAPLGGAPNLFDPLPIFQLGLHAAEDGKPPAAATMAGWWYPVIGGVEPAFAMLGMKDEHEQFAGLTYGILAKRLYQACVFAEKALGDSPENYEARIFDVPALRLTSLWLAGRHSVFVPLLEGAPPGTAKLRLIDDMEARIKRAVEKRRSIARTDGGGDQSQSN